MDSNADPIVVEQPYNVPAAFVWKAITDKDQMTQWYFEAIMDFDPEPGFATQFNVHHEGRDYLHVWKVTDVVPEKRITYNWQYGGISGDSSVTWELTEVPGGTSLKLTHEVHEPFPQDDSAFTSESCRAGWNYFLHDSLKAFLEPQGA